MSRQQIHCNYICFNILQAALPNYIEASVFRKKIKAATLCQCAAHGLHTAWARRCRDRLLGSPMAAGPCRLLVGQPWGKDCEMFRDYSNLEQASTTGRTDVSAHSDLVWRSERDLCTIKLHRWVFDSAKGVRGGLKYLPFHVNIQYKEFPSAFSFLP